LFVAHNYSFFLIDTQIGVRLELHQSQGNVFVESPDLFEMFPVSDGDGQDAMGRQE